MADAEQTATRARRRRARRGRAGAEEGRADCVTPDRTCAGCGRKAPQAELVRFAAVDGALTPGRTLPGRGVYTCRRLACFERALARRGLQPRAAAHRDRRSGARAPLH